MLIQNLKKSQNIQHFSPSKQTPLYENKQNEREIIQWRLLCFILKLSTDKIWLCKNERESVNGAIFPRMRLLLFFSQTLIFLPTLPAQTIELLLQSDKTQIEKWRTLIVKNEKLASSSNMSGYTSLKSLLRVLTSNLAKTSLEVVYR